MTTFLEEIIENVYPLIRRERCLFLLPNRRSGLHLEQVIARQIDRPVWAPDMLSAADFVQQYYRDGRVADTLLLLFHLYEVYRQQPGRSSEETFDAFYPWGLMMLRDFDEIDRYLIDGTHLYRNVRDLRELEERFGPDLADSPHFRQFWSTFSDRNIAPGDKRTLFLQYWAQLGTIYQQFKDRLKDTGLCYEGMAFRHLATTTQWLHHLPYQHLFICGFNALTASEKRIFKALEEQVQVQYFWDADTYYLDQTNQEAGHFLRENFKNGFSRPTNIGEYLMQQPKKITMAGASGLHGQVMAAAQYLARWQQQDDFIPEKTAIVLGDENGLFPLLYSLPKGLERINITMGFPLVHAHAYSLLQLLLPLPMSSYGTAEQPAFHHSDVIRLLQHPYLQWTLGKKADAIIGELEQLQTLFPTREWLSERLPEEWQGLFFVAEDARQMLSHLSTILWAIRGQLEAQEAPTQPYELPLFDRMLQMIQQLENLLKEATFNISHRLLSRLLEAMATAENLPFSGEPLEGLQIMGLLETRLLDFDRVMVLSVNEGHLPANARHQSYIPFGIRKAFGLPTFEQQDGIAAYHFYRLLQRCKEAILLYNNEQGKMNEGEPSRFLQQIKYEWAAINDQLTVEAREAAMPPVFPDIPEINIPKDDTIRQHLSRYLAGGDQAFSASSINTYLTCSLQFYFRYIAQIKEPETIDDEIDGKKLGEIFHEAMEESYKPYSNKPMSENNLNTIRSGLEDALLKAFRNNYHAAMTKPLGKNILNFTFLHASAKKILAYEKTQLPFTVMSTEESYTMSVPFQHEGAKHEAQFKGIIDRIDQYKAYVQIIDYKTGTHLDIQKGDALKVLDKIRTDPKKKANLQGLLYALLYFNKHPDAQIKVGFYHLLNIDEGPVQISDAPITKKDLVPFKQMIADILSELYDWEIPFSQTEDKKRCSYCPYNAICGRA